MLGLSLIFVFGCFIALGMSKRVAHYVVHPWRMIINILIVAFLSSGWFFIIGFMYLCTKKLYWTPMGLWDFGLIPLNCWLESAFGYLMEIYSILWNACWAYELVQCVKSPMVYSEKNHKYYQAFVYIIGLLFTAAAFTFYSL